QLHTHYTTSHHQFVATVHTYYIIDLSLYFGLVYFYFFFFFNDTATTEIYTLSLHDALPISYKYEKLRDCCDLRYAIWNLEISRLDRKSTRLNSSHLVISYAVFCLKKKKKNKSSSYIGKTHKSTCVTYHYLCTRPVLSAI